MTSSEDDCTVVSSPLELYSDHIRWPLPYSISMVHKVSLRGRPKVDAQQLTLTLRQFNSGGSSTGSSSQRSNTKADTKVGLQHRIWSGLLWGARI
jgi:hypothetical protein